MFFEGFEGYKKIKNIKKLNINEIYELFKKYENEIGSIIINENMIIIDTDNRYIINVYIDGENIIIERKITEKETKNHEDTLEQGKDLYVAQVDRMIEQLYDLLNDYIENNGFVSEHVTSVKKVLYMEEEKKLLLNGVFSLGSTFRVKDENNKNLYEAKQNHINKLYTIRNLETRREEFALKYENANENKFTIMKQPFETLEISQDETSVKTILKGNYDKKELKISADYTDNHYLIELNEIVIGAIDCLDPILKNKYKLEINDLKQESLIVAVGIMMDIYNLKNNNELGVQ